MRIISSRFLVSLSILLLLWGLGCTEASEPGNGETEALPDDITSLIEMLGQTQLVNQNEVIRALADKGVEAVPALIEALGEGDPAQTRAIHALAFIGEPAVPALIESLEDDNYYVRDGVERTLGEIGPAAADAIDPLKDFFGRVQKNEQVNIMYALASISPTPDVVAMLRVALRVEDLRYPALRVLGSMGSVSVGAIPAILPYLEHENDQTRIEAMMSLAGIGAEEGVVDGIAARLADEVPRVRISAAQSLGELGPDAGTATLALANALTDVEVDVQKAAATALGRIAPESRDAVPALARALDAENPQTRREVAIALGLLGGEATSALTALRNSAENDEVDYVRIAASQAIALIEAAVSAESE